MASDSARLQVIIESQYQGAPGLEALRRDAQAAGVSLEQVSIQARQVATETGQAIQTVARLQGTAAGTLADFQRQQAQQLQGALPAGGQVRATGPDVSAITRQRAQAEAQANAQAIGVEQQALAQAAAGRQHFAQQAEQGAARVAAAEQRSADQALNGILSAIEREGDARGREVARAQADAERKAQAEIAAQQRAVTQVALIRERLATGGTAQFQVTGVSPQQLQALQQSFRAANVEVEQLGASVSRTGQVARTLQIAPARGGANVAVLGPLLNQLEQGQVSGVRFTDSLSRGLRASTEEMSKLAQGIGHGLGLFSSFGAGIGTAVVTAAITAAIADTTRQFAVFDEQLRGTNALLGLTGQASEQSFQQMNRDVRAFAVATGTDAVNDTKALYQVLSAGIPVGAQAFQVLQAGANLAVGGLTDTKTAIDGVTSVLNAYRLNASDAAKISDQFFAATKAGKITVDQLAQGIGTAVPVAAALGVSFAELSAVIASATSQGVQAGAAFEGTRAALNAFLRPTAEAQQIAGRLGFEFDANVVKTKGFTGALNDVVRATGGSEQLLGQLFGDIQAVNTVLAITGPNAEGTARAINIVGTASGDAARAQEEVNRSLGRSFASAAQEWGELRLRLGEASAGPLKDALDVVTLIGARLGAWPETPPPADQIERFKQLGATAQGFVEPIQAMVTVVDQLTRALNDLNEAGPRARRALGGSEQANLTPAALKDFQDRQRAALGTPQSLQNLGGAPSPTAPLAERLAQFVVNAVSGGQPFTRSQGPAGPLTLQGREEDAIRRSNLEGRAAQTQAILALEAMQAAQGQAQRQAEGALQAARVHLPEVLPQVFAPQEAEIALQQAGLTQQTDAQRLSFERQLDPLQRQLQTLEAMRDITAETTVLHLNLERTLLDESHTRERALDLENQNLDATIRANDAREQGIRLGFVVPALQRVATAMGANVDPNSPEFQRLNVAQQVVALRLSTAQAQLRQGQIATDPGRLALDAQKRELDFRTQTAQLAADELKTRQQMDTLPIEQHIKQIELAEANALNPLQLRTAELKLQTDYYDRQKAVLQWMITHVPPEQLSTAILSGVPPDLIKKIGENAPLTPDEVQTLGDIVSKNIATRFPTTGTIDQGAIDTANKQIADTKSAADAAKAAADAAQTNTTAAPATVAPVEVSPVPVPLPPNAPAPGFPPEHQGVPSVPQVQGGTLGPTEIGPPVPALPIPDVVPQAPGGVPGAIGLGDQPTINQPPVIRGTGVQGSRSFTLQQNITVDASNQTDPDAIKQAVKDGAAQGASSALDSVQTQFDNSPSSNSIGAR